MNHLLSQNSWARQRLARFSGKSVRFDVAPFTLTCRILPDGSLLGLDAEDTADVRCVIPPSLLPRLALHDETAHAGISTEGDSDLLAEIFFLSRNLRWDAAEDLSHVTGDIVAERMVAGSGMAGQALLDTTEHLLKAGAEYLTEERPMLAKPGQISSFMLEVDKLRDDLARLEQRVSRLVIDRKG